MVVKNNLFRRIKFVTSQASFIKAFQKVREVERPKNPCVSQLTYEKCFTKVLNQKGVLVNRPVPKLRKMRSKIAKSAEKNSSHLRNSASPGDLHQTGKRRLSSGYSITSWKVFVGKCLEKCKNNTACFRGMREQRIKHCECKRQSLRFVANRQLLGGVESLSRGGGSRHWTNGKQQHNNGSRNRQREGMKKKARRMAGTFTEKSGTMQVQWLERSWNKAVQFTSQDG